jgi:glucose/arabinose dehydrogenase
MANFIQLRPWHLFLAMAIVGCADSSTANAGTRPQGPAPTAASFPTNVGAGAPAFWVRPGFKVELVAENFGEARFIEFGPDGTLYVAQPNKGVIKALRPKDGKYAVVGEFVTGYRSVHGLCYNDGWLWFTTSGGVYRARDKHGDGRADEIVPLAENLPSGGHWWRSIFVVKDGFFTSIGDSGNILEQMDTDRQKIWKYSLDGKTKKLWSSGIRNTEKLRYRPGTTELFGADHGSDWFGGPLGDKAGRQPITDYNPPCEFNLYTEGAFYGHPYIVGNRVPRIEFQNRPDLLEWAEKTVVPEWSFGAHWAPNGFAFITRGALKGDALVAMHGSWNSSKPVGYRVERVLFDNVTGKAYGAQMLVGTIGKDNKVLGRPVDVAQATDGTILFTDDQTNRIYRISKVGE